ncbi:DNA-3-methyladenine glycosylase family protein [Streptomyces sp. NPDC050504]|uniref:DNA-3-methyladenine glycosylase family protein n=1 Tax=Streptomyces sp. NPDC050504 TaxID=3365618 RepID=UPI0037A78610
MAGRYLPRPAPRGPVPQPRGAAAGAEDTGSDRTWRAPGPLDVPLILGPLRRGAGDPTYHLAADGAVWRASRTPQGPGTLRVAAGAGAEEAGARAWGPGAEWLLDRLPELLGGTDDPDAFVPRHRLLAVARSRRPGLRLVRTGLVLESLIPSVLEQKVTTAEAYRAWRLLVRQYGERAPGPCPVPMHVMPEPAVWARIPSWEWHGAGVDAKRSATVLRAVRVARRLEEAAGMGLPEASARLGLIPGIGPWTTAETLQRTNGAADAVTVGDLHLPGVVGYALAGEREADDARMLELLEPYEGQRHRAVRLVLTTGRTPPRRAPKMRKTNIATL